MQVAYHYCLHNLTILNILDLHKNAEDVLKKPWSKKEISAVMKHFRAHIANGDLASKQECEQCKVSEHPALKENFSKILGTL